MKEEIRRGSMVKSVHEVMLAVNDSEKVVALYEKLFGLKFDLSGELSW